MDFNHYCNKNYTDKGDLLPSGNRYANFYENWFSKLKNLATEATIKISSYSKCLKTGLVWILETSKTKSLNI